MAHGCTAAHQVIISIDSNNLFNYEKNLFLDVFDIWKIWTQNDKPSLCGTNIHQPQRTALQIVPDQG